jgi:hypothetical protein
MTESTQVSAYASEVILIIRLPARPSRLKVISMPAVLRNVWQRRNRAASALGFVGQAVVLLGAIFSSRALRRRSEAFPTHAVRSAMISRTKVATGSASVRASSHTHMSMVLVTL